MSMSIHPKFQKLKLVSGGTPPPPPPDGDPPAPKLFRGNYVKLEQWQIFTNNGAGPGFNTAKLNEIFNTELKTTPSLRGIKWAFEWGLIENTTGAPSTWNWAPIDELCQRLWNLRTGPNPVFKRLMLAFGFLQGGVTLAAKQELMPPDLVDKVWIWSSVPYDPNNPNNPKHTPDGVYPKLWDATVQSRILNFMTQLGNHVVPGTDGLPLDQGDLLCMMGTLESATRSPYLGTYLGGSLAQYQNGIINTTGSSVIKSMKLGLPNTPIVFGCNYTRAFIQSAIPMCPTLKVGLNTPNNNDSTGLVDPGGAPGILNYYKNPLYINNILLTIEVQGDDFKSTKGIDARVDAVLLYDFPSYEYLYLHCRNVYHADYIIWQRNLPFWEGGQLTEKVTKMPGTGNPGTYTWPQIFKDVWSTFLQPYPALNADPTGGLGVGKPVPPNYL